MNSMKTVQQIAAESHTGPLRFISAVGDVFFHFYHSSA